MLPSRTPISLGDAVNLGRQVLLTATCCSEVEAAYLRHIDRLLTPQLAPPVEEDLAVEPLHAELRQSDLPHLVTPRFGLHRADPEAKVVLVTVYSGIDELPPVLDLLDRLAPIAAPLAQDHLGFERRKGPSPRQLDNPLRAGALPPAFHRFPFGAVLVFDEDRRIHSVQGWERERFGLTDRSGALGEEAFPADAWSRLGPLWQAALQGMEDTVEVTVAEVPAAAWVSPVRGEDGGVRAGLCVLQNQAPRHHLQTHNEQLEELLEQVQRVAGVGMFQLDVATGALQWSAHAALVHGIESESVTLPLEQALERVTPEGRSRLRAAMDAGRRGSGRVSVRYPLLDGRTVHLDGELVYRGRTRWFGTVRDVSAEAQRDLERTRHEAELKEAARRAEAGERAKSEFLASVSHELRTPINGITGSVSLLASESMSEEARRLVALIERSSSSLLSTIDDVLDFITAEEALELDRQPVSVRELVDQVVAQPAILAKAKGLRFRCTVDPALDAPRLGDARRVRRVIRAVVSNALKFTDEGEVVVDAAALGEEVRLTVRDTGIGMSPEVQRDLFEAFQQAEVGYGRRFGGFGLGLTLAHRNLGAMGGTVSVDSTLGEGSTFVVRIPMPPTEPAAPSRADPSIALRVLVAEDNPVNQKVVSRMLKRLGHAAVLADDGEAAAAAVASEGPFDLVLMDVQMPRMDGIEATRAIRAWERAQGRAPTQIWALTANALDEDRRRCLAAGMDRFLTKPLRLDVLRAELMGPDLVPTPPSE